MQRYGIQSRAGMGKLWPVDQTVALGFLTQLLKTGTTMNHQMAQWSIPPLCLCQYIEPFCDYQLANVNVCSVEINNDAYFNHKLIMQLAECQPHDFKPGQKFKKGETVNNTNYNKNIHRNGYSETCIFFLLINS